MFATVLLIDFLDDFDALSAARRKSDPTDREREMD
jgi:hypothetical protein